METAVNGARLKKFFPPASAVLYTFSSYIPHEYFYQLINGENINIEVSKGTTMCLVHQVKLQWVKV